MKQEYIDTVRLLIDIAPTIFKSPRFAMKGGTALNLFVQDMPRLSVDIDVVSTDYAMARDEALAAIESDPKEAAPCRAGCARGGRCWRRSGGAGLLGRKTRWVGPGRWRGCRAPAGPRMHVSVGNWRAAAGCVKSPPCPRSVAAP